MAVFSRRALGPKFSEGARQLWLLMADGSTPADLARRLGADSGQCSRLLYGDRAPGLKLAGVIQEKLGIDIPLWNMPPLELFVPPAAQIAAPAPAPSEPASRRRRTPTPTVTKRVAPKARRSAA